MDLLREYDDHLTDAVDFFTLPPLVASTPPKKQRFAVVIRSSQSAEVFCELILNFTDERIQSIGIDQHCLAEAFRQFTSFSR